MTIEEEFRLSCYEELTTLDKNRKVFLVKNINTGEIMVKKYISHFSSPVYECLKEKKINGIPQIYDLILEEERLIVIEEYIHGQTLEQILEQKKKMDEAEVINIMLEICRILKYLHSQEIPIIHRDLKPSNVLYSNEKKIYVIDFDIARQYTYGQTQDTQFFGTEGYAAPEQYGFGQSDCRTDIYAAGTMMNRMLTGEFPNQKMAEGKCGEIIKKCRNIDAEERYASIEKLEADLMKRKKNFTKKPFERYRLPGFSGKNPWKMLLAGLGYLMILWLCISLEAEDSNGNKLYGARLWMERFCLFLCFMLPILFQGNYLGIRDWVIGKRKHRILLRIGMTIGIIFGIIIGMLLLESFIFGTV